MVRGVTTLKLKDIRHSDMEMFKISVSSLSDHKVWVFNGVNTSYSLNNSRKQTSDQLCVGLCHCDLMPPHFKTNQVSTGTFATYTMWAWKIHQCQSESNKLCAAWQSPLIQHVTQTSVSPLLSNMLAIYVQRSIETWPDVIWSENTKHGISDSL